MRILLATDGTKCSEAAAAALNNFTLGSDDEVTLITVVDMSLPMGIDLYGGYLPDTTELEKIAKDNADRTMEDSLQNLKKALGTSGVKITSEILFGSPESRIVETAETINADLIIIGSHGYKSWERLLLGSVSDSVVHHAPCSVMVVRSSVK